MEDFVRPETTTETTLKLKVKCQINNTMEGVMEAGGDEWDLDIYTASALGDCHTLKFLLNSGEDVNSTNWEGWSGLMYACSYLRLEAAKTLLASGADPNLKTPQEGTNILMMSATVGDFELLNLFYNECLLEETDMQGQTPLFYAVEFAQEGAAEFLLKKGADPNVIAKGLTPLMLAAKRGYTVIAKLLILYEADITLTGHDGKSARDWADQCGHLQVVALIDKYAFPDLKKLLTELGLEKYIEYFQKNSIDIDRFMEMTEEDMKNIGIRLFGPRRKMSMLIAQLKPFYKRYSGQMKGKID